MEKQVKHSC